MTDSHTNNLQFCYFIVTLKLQITCIILEKAKDNNVKMYEVLKVDVSIF